MPDEHTASESLFPSINLQQNPSPSPYPTTKTSELQENLVISHALVYHNIWFIKDSAMNILLNLNPRNVAVNKWLFYKQITKNMVA